MNIALVIISDRGDMYLPRALRSLAEHVRWDWSADILIDDSEHRLGMAGAVNEAWRRLPDDTDYVFHLEEDFEFLRDVPVDLMAETLERAPHLSQMVLKRPGWSAEEKAAGGIVEMHPESYADHSYPDGGKGVVHWLEHKRIFSMNPCLYPVEITRDGYPSGNEAAFTQQMLSKGYVFGIWGERAEDPYCEHLGAVRGNGWRL